MYEWLQDLSDAYLQCFQQIWSKYLQLRGPVSHLIQQAVVACGTDKQRKHVARLIDTKQVKVVSLWETWAMIASKF